MIRRCLAFLLSASLLAPLGLMEFAHADTPAAIPPAVNAPRPEIASQLPKGPLPLHARIVIDSLYCEKESKWDHGTSQDEPYVMITGFASHRDPNAWILGEPEVFKDVDSGNNRRFTKQNRVVYEGEVPKDAAIGFHVVLWERDASPKDTQYNLYQQLCRRINDNIVTSMQKGDEVAGLAGRIVGGIYGMVHSGWIAVLQQAASIVGGGGDDKVAESVIGWDYADLLSWADRNSHRALRVVLDGGDEGKYWLRYHIEFGENPTREFDAKFTDWDDIAVGNVDRIYGDEIVIVSDEDGSGANGRFYVYDGMGRQIRSFDAPYAPGDRLALGDTTGNGVSEIITASPFGGGTVRTYDYSGALMNRMNIPFSKHDGFAVGDLDVDGKVEIVTARPSDRKVYVHSSLDGRKTNEFGLSWPFKGDRYCAGDTKHDAFLVGDVTGDNRAEIVMIENKNSNQSVIRVYDGKGAEVTPSAIAGAFGATFTNYDAASLGDMYGDSKQELILAISDDSKSYTYDMYVIDLGSGKRVGNRSWPWYARRFGFAAGKVFAGAKAQIVVANGSDKKVYIGR